MSETLLFARGRLGVCWRTASGGGGRLGQRQNQPRSRYAALSEILPWHAGEKDIIMKTKSRQIND